jgi:prefoldin subunit 5
MKKQETIGTVVKELQKVQAGIEALRTSMSGLESNMNKRFDQVDARFDEMDDRLEAVAITAMRTEEIVEQLIPRLPVSRGTYKR